MRQENPTYIASAYHPSVGQEEVAGTLTLEPQQLVFRSENFEVELLLGQLDLDLDASGRIRFSDSEQTDWLLFTDDAGILKSYFITHNNRLRQMARGIRQQREGRRMLKLAGIFLVAFVIIVTAFSLLSRWTMRFLVSNVPISWEAGLADSILEDLQGHLKIVEDPELTATLKAASERLVRSLPPQGYKFEFRLVENPLPNAFALPGGRIFVNTGLVKTVSRPEEIAGVLAHEIAHITQRHGLRQVISTVGPYYVLKVFISDKRGFLSTISNGSQFLVQQSFSRDFEQEADDVGWRYLVAANIDPRGLAEFLQRMLADPLLRRLDHSAVRVLSSHPPTAERVDHLNALWRETKQKSGFVNLPIATNQ